MTARHLPKLAVGDRLLMVTGKERPGPGDEPKVEWVTVTKVGRQYGEANPSGAEGAAYLTRRFKLDSGFTDYTGRMTTRFYVDQEHYLTTKAAQEAWHEHLTLRHSFGQCPPGVTAEDIHAALKLLGMEPRK